MPKNSEGITDISVVSLPGIPVGGVWPRVKLLMAVHRSNLQNLSAVATINFVAAGLGFLTKVKIANVLGKKDFGLLVYGLALGTYAATLVNFGFHRTLVRDTVHFPDRAGRTIVSSLALRGLVLSTVLSGLLAWRIFWGSGGRLAGGIECIVMAEALAALDLRGVYDAWGNITRHSLYFFMYRCSYFAAVWTTVLLSPDRLSIAWLGRFMITSTLLYLALQYRWALARTSIGWNVGITRSVLQMAKSNFVIWVSTLAVLTMSVLNQILLKHFGGGEQLGEYSAAWVFVTIAASCLDQIGRIGNAAAARVAGRRNAARTQIRFLMKYTGVMLTAAAPISLLAAAFPHLLLGIVFKPEYSSAAGVLRILGLYIAVYATGLVASQYVVAARMERTYLVGVLAGGVMSIVLSLAMIPTLGPLGSACAVLISHVPPILIYYRMIAGDLRRGVPGCECNVSA
jgi:O-antigen/teichoic acid export membrane protein